MTEKIEKIERLDKLVKDMDKLDNEPISRVEPSDRQYFDRLMAEGANQKQQQVAFIERQEVARKISPMEAAIPTNRPTHHRAPTTEEILAQTNDAVQRMESIKRKLTTPGLDMANAEVHNLKNKLSHMQDSIKVALGKVGLDYTPPDTPKGLISPLHQFIGYMTHGQAQLEGLNVEINAMHDAKTSIDPGKMLALQAKIGFVNHELEFFASALNKALESFKTIMNVQV